MTLRAAMKATSTSLGAAALALALAAGLAVPAHGGGESGGPGLFALYRQWQDASEDHRDAAGKEAEARSARDQAGTKKAETERALRDARTRREDARKAERDARSGSRTERVQARSNLDAAENEVREREADDKQADKELKDARDVHRDAKEEADALKRKADELKRAFDVMLREGDSTEPADGTPGDATPDAGAVVLDPQAVGAGPGASAGVPPAPTTAPNNGEPVVSRVLPNGDVVLARGPEQVVIPNGVIRGVNEAQAAVARALADPEAVDDLAAFVDRVFRAGNEAALTTVVFALPRGPSRADLASVRDQASQHLGTLAEGGSMSAQDLLAAIDRRVDVLKAQDAGSLVGARLRTAAGTLVQQGWQGVVVMDYSVVLAYVANLHGLARSGRSAQEQEAIAGQLVGLFDESRALQGMIAAASLPGPSVGFGDTVLLKPLDGGAPAAYHVVRPDQARGGTGVSSGDPTGQVLLGRREGDVVELGGRRFQVTITRSSIHPTQQRALARNRLGEVQGLIQSLLTIPGAETPAGPEDSARLEHDLSTRAGTIRAFDTLLADRENRLVQAQLSLTGAREQLGALEASLAARSPTELATPRGRDLQQEIERQRSVVTAAEAAEGQARAERDRVQQERNEAFTNYAILGVPVDGKPLYVQLATGPGGQAELIEEARRQQIATTTQQLVWWGTEATLTEKVAFFAVLTGTQQQIQDDPTLQALFGANGLRARVQIAVGAGDAAEIEKAKQRLAGDVTLTVLAIPAVFFPPLGIGLAAAGVAKAGTEFEKDAATARQVEEAAQGGIATRAEIGDRNRAPSVGFLVFAVSLELVGGAGDAFATFARAGGTAADAAGTGSRIATGGDATRPATAAGAGEALPAPPSPASPGGAGTLTPQPRSAGAPAGGTGGPGAPRGPPSAEFQGRPTELAPELQGSQAPTGALAPAPPAPASPSAGFQGRPTELAPELQGSPAPSGPLPGVSSGPPTVFVNPRPAAVAPGSQLQYQGAPGAGPRGGEVGAVLGAGGQGTVFEARLVVPPADQNTPFTARFDPGPDSLSPRVVDILVSPVPAHGRGIVKVYMDPDTGRLAFQAEVEGANYLRGIGIRVPETYGVGGLDGVGQPYIVRERLFAHPLTDDYSAGTASRLPTEAEGPVTYKVEGRQLTPAEQAAKTKGLQAIADKGGAVPDAKPDNEFFEVLPDGTVRWGLADTQFAGPIDDPFVRGQFDLVHLGRYPKPVGYSDLSIDQQFDTLGEVGLANAFTLHRFGDVVFDQQAGTFVTGRMDPTVLRQAFPPFERYASIVEGAWRDARAAEAALAGQPSAGATAGSLVGSPVAAAPPPASALPGTSPGAPGAPTTPAPAGPSSPVGAAAHGAAAAVRGAAGPSTGDPASGPQNLELQYGAPSQSPDRRVSLIPGRDGKLRIAVRLTGQPGRLLEILGLLPAPLRTAVVQTIGRVIPSARRVALPEDAGAAMAFSFHADDAAVQQLTASLRALGVDFRTEGEATLVIQGTRR
jgi:transcription elongation GreA/GreB family factor